MPSYGQKSMGCLMTCHPDLILLANEVIKYVDISIVCGYRDKAAQDEAFNKGNSKTPWPQSKHNKLPSYAFDFMPYPDTGKIEDYRYIGGMIVGIAHTLGLKIRYGGDWDKDDRVSDETFIDAGHVEKE